MWTYNQRSGKLLDPNGEILAIGYAGNGSGKNNPLMENVKNIGCLPKGIYSIGQPYNSTHTGPFTLPLTPNNENNMFGRSGFKIHGDNIGAPGTASQGCIIIPRSARIAINESTDKQLKVVE